MVYKIATKDSENIFKSKVSSVFKAFKNRDLRRKVHPKESLFLKIRTKTIGGISVFESVFLDGFSVIGRNVVVCWFLVLFILEVVVELHDVFFPFC